MLFTACLDLNGLVSGESSVTFCFITLNDSKMDIGLIIGLVFLINIAASEFNPGDNAPSFILPTLSGPLVYKALNNTNIKPPIIFHEFNVRSGFVEALWNDDASIVELLKYSPNNTQYVFFTSSQDAEKVAEWMKGRFKTVLKKHSALLTEKTQK